MVSEMSDESRSDLVLMTTSDTLSPRNYELARLVASIETFKTRHPYAGVRMNLLMQRCTPEDFKRMREMLPEWVNLFAAPIRMSVSKARNFLLAKEHGGLTFDDNDIVAFPDDDCWYPEGVIERIHHCFMDDRMLDFWLCRYASHPVHATTGVEVKPKLQSVISRGSSNTIFFRGSVVRDIGGFDEILGVGAEINGGEDTDFVMRAYYRARKTLFVDEALIGHRDPNPQFRSRYYTGSFIAIARYSRKSFAGVIATARKAAIGAYMVLTGKLEYRAFASAMRYILK
jgi:hypothetical protein